MGTHISRVKSVDLDAWTDEQMQSILRWGNTRANKSALAVASYSPCMKVDHVSGIGRPSLHPVMFLQRRRIPPVFS